VQIVRHVGLSPRMEYIIAILSERILFAKQKRTISYFREILLTPTYIPLPPTILFHARDTHRKVWHLLVIDRLDDNARRSFREDIRHSRRRPAGISKKRSRFLVASGRSHVREGTREEGGGERWMKAEGKGGEGDQTADK